MNRASRRDFVLGGLSAATALHAGGASAHNDAGRVVPPQAPPAVSLTLDDGAQSSLQALLKGRVTALQLMFTSCQATCPLQGALFGEALKKLGDKVKSAQLVSISIDPGQDTPARLREWLKRFGATPRWRAGRPEKAQLEALSTFLKSQNPGPDPHTPQVYFFDREGKLALRSVDFPPAAEIAKNLQELAGKS
jgi:protein SCO1/2